MQIQRWQTLLLLIASIMMILMSLFPLATIQGATQTVSLTAFGIYTVPGDALVQGNVYVGILILLAAVLAAVGIFMYKATRRQRQLCWLISLLSATAVVCEWVLASRFVLPGAEGISWSGICFAPFIAIAAALLAMRCIRSDEKKLAGYDRLR